MVTVAVLISFTRFDRWSRRAGFMAASMIVPIIANGVRAWGTIYIAQSHGVEFAAGFDHIFYGWIFFAIVVAMTLSIAWRFFERDSQDYGWSTEQVGEFAWLPRLEGKIVSPFAAPAAIAALAAVAAITAAIVATAALG